MEDKASDVIYCGASKRKILNAKPKLNWENTEVFYRWIKERYKIHLKKDILKQKPPWTDDEILMKYRFTNVRREHDRETRWLIKNICENDNITYENKILNIIMFRLFNKSETLKVIGLIDFNNINVKELGRKINEYRKKIPRYIFFSNAFYTSGSKRAANLNINNEKDIVVKIVLLVKKYLDEGIIARIKSARNQKEVYESLIKMPGIGQFLAYQIFVDLSYLNEFQFSENEFVIAGPGCKKGLNLIFNEYDGLSYEEALFWLRDNQMGIFSKFGYAPRELFSDLPENDQKMNVMSIENCMCEISKYIRALKGDGRPRIRYKPKQTLEL